MMKAIYVCTIVLFFLFFNYGQTRNSFAHEGHDHSHDTAPVTIERSTYTHFQSILSIYQETYLNLIKGQLSSISVLAQILLDTAGKGIQTETRESGRHMMQHIYDGAQKLRQAEGLQETQKAFASISEAILPFFKSWPNQLNSNNIKLFQCKEHENYWLQPQNLSPICPYTLDKLLNCTEIIEVIEE
ncbi:MAG: hypothetical protein SCARUB_03825 [Candidatus Scalindua rubra]|uniref:DUF3347 domain-containing protein n=1 Tax=Candidatus Scalindua rubra TaxID=1872076 RepID=A0A1E3X5Z5_9BACT|nr:MAG: hypothetical protein SCARUB_03825 [Candidatus Scalindua rubra]